MQQFITSDKFQDPYRFKPHHTKEPVTCKPATGIVRNIMAYAAALKVFKTKCAGDLYVLMN